MQQCDIVLKPKPEFHFACPFPWARVSPTSCAHQDDEGEHVKTMYACQQLDYTIVSPHRMKAEATRKQQEEGKEEIKEIVPEAEGVQEAANKGNFLSKWFN